MHDRGFGYQPVPAAELAPQNPYGLLDEQQARNDGYGMTSAALAQQRLSDPNQAETSKLPADRQEAWNTALVGTGHDQVTLSAPGAATLQINTDSCVYQSRNRLYGQGYDQLNLQITGLESQVIASVLQSQTFLAAQQRWADCIAGHGGTATTLQQDRAAVRDALAHAGSRPDALHATARAELDAAKLDATCQDTAHLAAAVQQAQADAETHLDTHWHDQASALLTARHAALAAATPVQG
ncbi:hypothetical protein [Kitasatospora sp. NPDC093558]|uniref:hypothetical protein n=1 Tax=Kitasatospora sp. NPDC093558 TaxID=3155201 RepID=UPI00341B3AD9